MPEKIVTPNDILVSVFCKSGENVWYLLFAQKNILIFFENFYIFWEKQQFKAVLHLLFSCLNPFLSLTHMHVCVFIYA